MAKKDKNQARARRKKSIRKRISGTTERPRLSVYRSNKHIYAQVIDDTTGKTVASASTLDKGVEKSASNVECATNVGKLVAERAKEAKVEAVIFDRGGHLYHGKNQSSG